MEYYEKRDEVYTFEEEHSLDFIGTDSDIQKFFDGKSVFITGGSGFLGCLLVENLLRTCPTIKKIYILLRSKKGKSPDERINTLLKSEVFKRIRELYNEPEKKIQAIDGDISLPYCGISEEDRKCLIENVDVVYHTAACLKMDEHLRMSYYLNVRATQDLLDLGVQMKNLKAFVYVSTAYSNSFRSDISEVFYDTVYSASELKDLLGQLSDFEVSSMMPKLIWQWNNSYAFTKAIAEKLVEQYGSKIPAVVARPSIVIGCEKEPLKGWINNFYGPTGVFLAACLGLMRVWYGGTNKLADIIPADKVTTALVAIAWQTGINTNGTPVELPVYNIVTTPKSPQTWMTYMEKGKKFGMDARIPTKKFIRTYKFRIEDRYWLFKIQAWLYHFAYGVVVDQILKMIGKKPMLLKAFTKIHKFNMCLQFYATSEWTYDQKNLDTIWSNMSHLDKRLYNFSMADFDWDLYHSYIYKGIAINLLKDDFRNLRRTRILYYIVYPAINILINILTSVGLLYLFRHHIFNIYRMAYDSYSTFLL